jgi:hypothetical protein
MHTTYTAPSTAAAIQPILPTLFGFPALVGDAMGPHFTVFAIKPVDYAAPESYAERTPIIRPEVMCGVSVCAFSNLIVFKPGRPP